MSPVSFFLWPHPGILARLFAFQSTSLMVCCSRMVIAPSLLAANFSRLADEVKRAERAGADWLHLDVMDGHFVPNLTIGPAVVSSLRPLTRLPFDVHLMCSRPEILLEPFA